LLTYFNIIQLLISAVLILVILLQSRGEAFSGTFSSDSSVFRTRRGIEKTLFNFTLVLATVFVILSIISVIVAKNSVPV